MKVLLQLRNVDTGKFEKGPAFMTPSIPTGGLICLLSDGPKGPTARAWFVVSVRHVFTTRCAPDGEARLASVTLNVQEIPAEEAGELASEARPR